jgi:methionyl-tRNA synthetase
MGLSARPFYVTTPIYYVNDVPHLGSAYTTIAADCLRRYARVRGRDARMLTGTDEHGEKAERAAQEQRMPPEKYVESMSARFKEAWPQLAIETDDFIRTHEERHARLVEEIWKKIQANGDIYLGDYEGWYCVGCEGFKTEKDLIQPGNQCPLHPGKPVEWLKEPTYFFKLKKYQPILLDFYARHPEFIEPESRRNEVLSFVKAGLEDLSVSRTSFTWGIHVPGDPRHVMYVWFDALANYWTALAAEKLDDKYWTPHGEVVHLVGKDILRFHTVYWPAFLLAAGFGEAKLPSKVFAHGFLTVDGMKMSKSLRNTVSPIRLAKELAPYGGADVVRYTLMRAIAFGQDGDFDHRAMIERYNADLAKNVGNLLSRTLGLCSKLTSGRAPMVPAEQTDLEAGLNDRVNAAFRASREAWDAIAPHRALEAAWDVASAANQYVDRAAPWTAAKTGDQARVDTILGTLCGVLEAISVMIWPVLPSKAQEMRTQLGLPAFEPSDVDQWPVAIPLPRAARPVASGTPLFPTIDPETERALLDRLAPKTDASFDAPLAPSPTQRLHPASAPPGKPSAPPPTVRQLEDPLRPSAPDTRVLVTYDDFAKVDLRVGVVKTCERVPKKDKLLRLMVDLGEPELRQIVAGLALSFTPEQLVGRKVVVVANLVPREFGKGLVSNGMLLASGPSEKLVLATVDADVTPGAKLK